jgi:hypothetical protein
MKHVKIANIHWHPSNPQFVYARLVDAKTNELLISATLDYIFAQIFDVARQYHCVNVEIGNFGESVLTSISE